MEKKSELWGTATSFGQDFWNIKAFSHPVYQLFLRLVLYFTLVSRYGGRALSSVEQVCCSAVEDLCSSYDCFDEDSMALVSVLFFGVLSSVKGSPEAL
jgi:hypothetical protein